MWKHVCVWPIISPGLLKREKEKKAIIGHCPGQSMFGMLCCTTQASTRQTRSVSHTDSRLPFAAVGSTGHFATFTALSSRLGGGKTWQCWCLCQSQKELLFLSPWFQPPSYFILYKYLVPFSPHQTSHSHCLVNAVSLTSPESPFQSSSFSASLYQSVLPVWVQTPFSLLSFCHSLCSSASSCALLACSWTKAFHGGQSCCSRFIWQDLLNGTAVSIWYCRKKQCLA